MGSLIVVAVLGVLSHELREIQPASLPLVGLDKVETVSAGVFVFQEGLLEFE